MFKSKTLEELNIGDSDSMTLIVTEEAVNAFAKATGDYNPLHVDAEFASKSVFGQRIAHGVLLNGIVSGLLGTQFPGLGTVAREMTSKFCNPVFLGDTITASAEVIEKKEKLNMCKLRYKVINQDGKVAVKGTAVVLPKRK